VANGVGWQLLSRAVLCVLCILAGLPLLGWTFQHLIVRWWQIRSTSSRRIVR
jgi:hypothetical protein